MVAVVVTPPLPKPHNHPPQRRRVRADGDGTAVELLLNSCPHQADPRQALQYLPQHPQQPMGSIADQAMQGVLPAAAATAAIAAATVAAAAVDGSGEDASENQLGSAEQTGSVGRYPVMPSAAAAAAGHPSDPDSQDLINALLFRSGAMQPVLRQSLQGAGVLPQPP